MKSREQIYREVLHEYYVRDAKDQVEYFLEIENADSYTGEFNYDYLATMFEEYHDCNIADNDMWLNLILDYVKAKGIKLHIRQEKHNG